MHDCIPIKCPVDTEILISHHKICSNHLKPILRTSLVVHCLGLHTPSAGAPGSIPGQGSRSCMPQLKDPVCSNCDPAQSNPEIPLLVPGPWKTRWGKGGSKRLPSCAPAGLPQAAKHWPATPVLGLHLEAGLALPPCPQTRTRPGREQMFDLM